MVSADSDWETMQGPEPDLVAIDEECDAGLWRELQKRRRAGTKTRYIISATATGGLRWMYTDLYKPWLEWHQKRGLSEEQAMLTQGHEYDDEPSLRGTPGVWCWARGGVGDNPVASEADAALYRKQTYSSEAERQVRLYGGFRDFSGQPVFEPENLERMRVNLETLLAGCVERVEARRPGEDPTFRYNASGNVSGGRVTLFREPEPGRTYSLGIDSALGTSTGDASAAVMLDDRGEQVLTATGQWGHAAFLQILLPVCEWFRPFVVGERPAGGLEILRALHGRGHWLYFDRDEAKRSRPMGDRLGHHPVRDDPPVKRLQEWIGPRGNDGGLLAPRVVVRDAELHAQLCRFCFKPRSASLSVEAAHDSQLVWGAPSGEHDDLVRALALAVFGLEWLPAFEQPKPKAKPGQLGQLLAHDRVFGGEEEGPQSSLDRWQGRKPWG